MSGYEDLDPTVRIGIIELAREMEANGAERDGPVRSVLALVGDRWSTLVLLVLKTGDWRHADLRRVLARLSSEGEISQRVLTLKLRMLERDGLVLRRVEQSAPPKVSYRLSDLGARLVDQIRPLIGWIGANRDVVKEAQRAFEAHQSGNVVDR